MERGLARCGRGTAEQNGEPAGEYGSQDGTLAEGEKMAASSIRVYRMVTRVERERTKAHTA